MSAHDEPHVDSEILNLLSQPESETLEFKSYVPDAAQLARVVSAFANAKGGTIVVGVGDRGAVVGCDISRLRQSVEQARRRVYPPHDIRLTENVVQGKKVGLVRVPASDAMVFAEDGSFVRVGASVKHMPATDIASRLSTSKRTEHNSLIAEAIVRQTNLIQALQDQVQTAHSWKGKAKDYVVSGIVGAIIGWLLSRVLS